MHRWLSFTNQVEGRARISGDNIRQPLHGSTHAGRRRRAQLGPYYSACWCDLINRQEQWRATPKSVFQVATTENRDLHLAVLSLFAERELTDPALTLDLLNALPHQAPDLNADGPGIRRSLDQLVEWQLLDESRYESATYRIPEEF